MHLLQGHIMTLTMLKTSGNANLEFSFLSQDSENHVNWPHISYYRYSPVVFYWPQCYHSAADASELLGPIEACNGIRCSSLEVEPLDSSEVHLAHRMVHQGNYRGDNGSIFVPYTVCWCLACSHLYRSTHWGNVWYDSDISLINWYIIGHTNCSPKPPTCLQ